MSCGSGGCASGGCATKSSSGTRTHTSGTRTHTSGTSAGTTAGGCSTGATGSCGSGVCGTQVWDGSYRSVVGVQVGGHARTWYSDSSDHELVPGDRCIIEGEHGDEFARVVQGTGPSRKFAGVPNMKRVLRQATPEDLETQDRERALAREAGEYARAKIKDLKLDIKVVDVESSFDGRRMTFSFTSEERVDFRDLVRELAQQYKRRIELRQIGARDEAKQLGGYGTCGRPLCCSTFLKEFPQISIKMAKRQGIAMNPSKISGLCGRLMCCLRYEDYDDPKSLVPGPEPAPNYSSSSEPPIFPPVIAP